MIRKYPTGDQERDARVAPKRDGIPKFGEFGTIVYVYRLALESKVQTNMKDYGSKGYLYHPVDTAEEAIEWLKFYRSKSQVNGFEKRPLYEDAWFVPSGEE